MSSELSDDLTAAKALIDTPEKWRKGNYSNSTGQMCALGAVNKALAGTPYADSERATAARLALTACLPTRYWRGNGVAAFNDSRRRLHSDILALFDRAIEAARD